MRVVLSVALDGRAQKELQQVRAVAQHDGEGAARRVETPASAGLSGLSSLFDGTHSPAEVEAAMHRETMHAAAAAAVQAAMGGATAVPEGKGDFATATRRRENAARVPRDAAESAFRR